jgi:hypothetical protein
MATLVDASGAERARAVYSLRKKALPATGDVGLALEIEHPAPGVLTLQVRCDAFADTVHLDVPGHVLEDNYFHLPAGARRAISARAIEPVSRTAVATLRALNHAERIRIPLSPKPTSEAPGSGRSLGVMTVGLEGSFE